MSHIRKTKQNGRSKINALVYYVAGVQVIPGIGEESIMPRVMIGNNTLAEKKVLRITFLKFCYSSACVLSKNVLLLEKEYLFNHRTSNTLI